MVNESGGFERVDKHGNRHGASLVSAVNAEPKLWATPNTFDGMGQRSYEAMKRQATTGGRKNRERPSNLREQVDPEMCQAYVEARQEANMWPTPKATDFKGSVSPERAAERMKESSRGVDLSEAITRKMLPTPLTSDAEQNTSNPEYYKKRIKTAPNLSVVIGHEQGEEIKGQLNPNWVEPLMGYPVGWTDLEKDDVTHEITEFVSNPDFSGQPRVTTQVQGRAQRLKQLGNSIVPQIAAEIFKQIAEAEKSPNRS